MFREIPNINIFKNTKEEVLNYYNNNSYIIDEKKKEKGEVFTPIHLVEKMLDKFPNDVWTNPDLKWLDNSAGMGAFPICVFYRLMDGLKDTITDEDERKRWIIKKMLYMVELDKNNCDILEQIFNFD